MTLRLALLAMLLLALAGCVPAAPADLELQGLAAGGTQTAVAVYAYRTQVAAIEATRSAGEELARRSMAAQAEIDLINRRAEAEGTALAGQVTAWAMAEAQARATQAPQQTAYAMALTEPARAATAQAIANRRALDQQELRRSADWEDFKLFAAWVMIYAVVLMISIGAVLLIIAGLRHTAVRENNNGTVVIFDGLLEPRVGVARREQLPAQVQQRRLPVYDGRYVIGADGRRYWAEPEQEQPEPEVVEADYYEPQSAPPEPEAPRPTEPAEKARQLIEASIQVYGHGARLIAGHRELDRGRVLGRGWSSSHWQNCIDYLEKAKLLAPGQSNEKRAVSQDISNLGMLLHYIDNPASIPYPTEWAGPE